MLDTTRHYALERLAETGERDVIFARHAAYYTNLLESAATLGADENVAQEIDNVRTALRWESLVLSRRWTAPHT